MSTQPAARFKDLVMNEVGDEVLVYDQGRHHIHHLNGTTATVWRLCDGRRTCEDLARAATASLGSAVSTDLVRIALTKLDAAHLLESPLEGDLRRTPQTRRSFMRRTAIAGAVAVPMLVSMSAPTTAGVSFTCNQAGVWPEACEINGAWANEGDCCCDDWENGADPGCGYCHFTHPGNPNVDPICVGAN
jgi:hypothetical protein